MASSASTLVIGSSSGIGFSIAQRLRTRGDSIVELASTLDLTNAEAVGESLRSLVGSGTVDYVVLAAIDPSAFRSAPIVSLTESEWDQAAEYSMRSAFVALQQAHGVLADGGRVILILPTVAATGVAGLVPLCTAVETIRVMAKAVARRWGARSITVNTIEVELGAFMLGDNEVGDTEVPVVPVLGQPALPPASAVDDVIGLIDMLATPAAGAITGALLVADRGTVMQP
ncbi:MAG: SDR family oxidoreductase [Acidimicrobiia bacterium]|nr:SDR family oxidoreductase [Acidimicrobiia bacterium]